VTVRWVVPEAGSELAIGLLGRDLGHSIDDCFHLAAAFAARYHARHCAGRIRAFGLS
jgi:hypothetical protein